MPSGDVTLVFRSDSAQAAKGFARLENGAKKMAEQLKKTHLAGKKGAKGMNTAFAKSTKQLARLNKVIAKQEFYMKRSGTATRAQQKRLAGLRGESRRLEHQFGRTGKRSVTSMSKGIAIANK